jgi:DNA end-binding protein Ku
MARSLQSASLSFGLVNIPVKLYTAASSKSVAFHMLHEKDGSRIRNHLFCEAENKQVSRDEVVKGYEVTKGRYVEVTDEELTAMEEAANHNVEILEFVPLGAVDPVYFQKTYYLGPDKGGEKPYRLLVEAMKQQNRGAVAKFVMRGKETLVMVRPYNGDHLALNALYYADEVRDVREIDAPKGQIRDGELKLAQQLLENLSTDKWDPEKYQDTYRERVLELIRKKEKGQAVVAPERARTGEVLDLMSALKRSLENRDGRKAPAKAVRRKETHRKRKAG